VKQAPINIRNKKAFYEYEIIERLTAGIVLTGTEIKSIRAGQASIKEAYCDFNENGELFVINMYVKEFSHASFFNHEPRNARKLLLTKRELKKWKRKVQDKGMTMVPLKLFISDKGFAKLEIALAKGKKKHDKRHSIKDRDVKRSLDRIQKKFNN